MKKFFKIIFYSLGGIVLLLLVLVLFLVSAPGKRFVRDKAVAFLKGKLKTEVSVGAVEYSLPKMVGLRDVLLKDQQSDTLLSVGLLKVDIDLLRLLKKEVVVHELQLEHVYANAYRKSPDTAFNFTYIINAFSGTPDTAAAPKDTSSSPLTFEVGKIKLKDIRARFDDGTGGINLVAGLDELELRMKTLDPAKMIFRLKTLKIDGLKVQFLQDTSLLASNDTTSSAMPVLAADELDLRHIDFYFKSKLSGMTVDAGLGHLLTHPDVIDLTAQQLAFKDLLLDSTRMAIVVSGQPETVADTAVAANTDPGWRIQAAIVKLNAVAFQMDNTAQPRLQQGMDYGHLGITDLFLDAKQLNYAGTAVSGTVNHLSVKEKSGLDLRELRTSFAYTDTAAWLHDLYLETPRTVLRDKVEIFYPSIASLSDSLQLLRMAIQLDSSVVGMPDVLLFAPQLRQQEQLRRYANESVRLDVLLNGYMNHLDIGRFHVVALKDTRIDLSGQLNGLPDTLQLNYRISIKELQSSRNDLLPFLPAQVVQNLRLPDRFKVNGFLSGTAKDYNPDLLVQSTDGNARIRGSLAMSRGTGKERYELQVQAQQLNIGRIIRKDTLMGPVTANLSVKGSSFDIRQMTAELKGSIKSAMLKGYNYNSISFDGAVAAQKGSFNLLSDDPNARLRLQAQADLSPKYPAVLADLIIDSANLQALKLYKDPLKVQATIHAAVPVLDPAYPDGLVSITRPTVATAKDVYHFDSLYVVSRPNADSGQFIHADLGFLNAVVTGKIPLTQIGAAVQEHINRHYRPADTIRQATVTAKSAAADSAKALPAQYNLNLLAALYQSPFLKAFLPELTQLDTVRLAANIDERSMRVDMQAPRLVYATNNIRDMDLLVVEQDSGLSYHAGVAQFTREQLKLLNTAVEGMMEPGLITADLSTEDEQQQKRFALGAALQQQENDQVISLSPGMILNYDSWTVAQPNKIVFGKDGFYVQNLKLSSGAKSISAQSKEPVYNAPLTAVIEQFGIADIMKLVSGDTLLADGMINGKLELTQLKPAPMITADLRVAHFAVLQDTIGDISVTANSTDENTINAQLAISGYDNDLQVKGNYYMKPQDGNNFNMELLINALNLKRFEGLAQQQIRNSSGFIRGKLDLRGTVATPVIRGELKTDELKTTVAMLNAPFYMPKERIAFDESGIRFDHFNILDSAKNKATIDGSILTKNFRDMMLELDVKAKNWKVLNAAPSDNQLFYGSLLITTNLDIKGPLTGLDINGSLNILKGTDVTVVLPESRQSMEDMDGIVVFTDSGAAGRLQAIPAKDSTAIGIVSAGSVVDVNITTDDEAQFNVIIDKATGDFLRVRGKASLNTAVDAGGSLLLNGLYELKDGAYELNYNLIKRRFDIQKGSTITFAGDPLEAQVNMTAVYKANVAPYDLVERQVTDPAQLIYYRQALPFEVQLLMKGPLMMPALNFNIDLPENNTYRLSSDAIQLVQSKLSQLRMDTSELNKQVFALLILKRFITDDPLSSEGGGGVGFAAKQSVSRFIGEQLNQIANRLIRGVDLSVDLASTEDYTTGERRERTDLNIAASKRLFNDRLKVTIGNNFELEGPQTKSTDPNSSLIPGNLAVDYNLSADGRYMIRAYRQNQDQGVIQGFVTETGVNFILNYDYNKFKNLFIRKKVLEMRRAQRQEKRNSPTQP